MEIFSTAYVVNLYGLYDPELRCGVEMRGYDEYLQACVNRIMELSDGLGRASREVACVVLCGGVTNPRSTISEARSVEPLVKELLNRFLLNADHKVILSEISFNTAQNIHDGLAIITDVRSPVTCDRIIVFCDEPRVAKALALVQYYRGKFNISIPLEVQGFPRQDINPKSTFPEQLSQALHYATDSKLIEEHLKLRGLVS